MNIAEIKLKYPNRVPVYVHKKEGSDIDDVPKHKYLVPEDMTLGNLIYIIRKNIKLTSEKALFVFIDNKLSSNSNPIGELYNRHKNEDGFLYLIYTGENTFG